MSMSPVPLRSLKGVLEYGKAGKSCGTSPNSRCWWLRGSVQQDQQDAVWTVGDAHYSQANSQTNFTEAGQTTSISEC
jgi:hypothetical protein